MEIANSFLYFIIAIAILIAVHEWGHFIVARAVGIKVLRFSIGFGRPILKYQSKSGTEYVLSIFPLGGYVSMLDEEEGDVPAEEVEQAFNRKSVWARMAVVVAGPALNFIFAVFALWLMFMIGISSIAPIIGEVSPNSIAAKAGLKPQDEITRLAERKIGNWRDFQIGMMSQMGSANSVALSVVNKQSNLERDTRLDIKGWDIDPNELDILKSLGIKPYVPLLKPILGQVVAGDPAEQAGLKIGDEILAVNNQPIKYWYDLLVFMQNNKAKPVTLTILRDKQKIDVRLQPKVKKLEDKEVGFIGVVVKKQYIADDWIRKEKYSLLGSVKMALFETYHLTAVSVEMIWKFISGKVSLRNIGGPIGVAQGASQSAQIGLAYYLSFLALVSVSLGVLNLLPIPMLDGGLLLYYIIEVITGKPVSRKARERLLWLGAGFLLALTLLAAFNDISRLIN